MVFKHNKLPFDHDDSLQLSFQHMTELDYGDQFASSVHRYIPEKQQFADGVSTRGNFKLQNVDAVNSDGNYGFTNDKTSSLPEVMRSDDETARLESSKRPFDDDENLVVAVKRTRQLDGNFLSFGSTCEQESLIASLSDTEFKDGKDAAVSQTAKDSHGSNFCFPWFSYRTNDESRLETPVQLSFFPGYYEDYHWPVRFNRVEESESLVFNYPPRKRVAIGQGHQAIIPAWRSKSFPDSCRDGPGASTSAGHILTDDDLGDKWTGHCVMPMPESTSLSLVVSLGHSKFDCCCLDEGSIRCVRQHVMEAREELRSILGHERFVDLGLCDMGEDATLGWTEEEEQLFRDVVASNPASLGKNFWDDLPRVFPSKSSKELVSYYFNVFMLRKRAEQNRSDPLNVDSDNDEWQESDNCEFGFTRKDEEDDSAVESPADVAAEDNGVVGDGLEDIHEDAEEDYCEHEDYGISAGGVGDDKSIFSSRKQHKGLHTHDSIGEDQEVHDDSCTSYEGQHNSNDSSGGRGDVLEGDHGNLHPEYRNEGVSGMTDHDLVVGHYDSKPWEIGYFHGFDKGLDFLPTCNVIEEVCGHESWEKSREGNGVS
ncbi:uncharacterized protein A4U43_C08F15980 [Asparagus officinalis]|uniref:uncharacterized protein LOC109851439 n=1 Tax=Asparagus officinalis TaxID=4686 RepID=UPI00098E7216|nr:uncharacterized protein LOC109851439 [Asparagus officinalis]ONK60249.1 uncharacterized protein A4U43_C08F15980 [Asparagus officinalis]